MKKIYIAFLFSGLSFGAYAQGSLHFPNLDAQRVIFDGEITPDNSYLNKAAAPFDTIWSESFANGIPSEWVQSGTNKIWRQTFKGSSGQYAGSSPVALASPTKTNGFMIFDADSLNTAGDQSYPDLDGSLITDTFDLSGYPDVKLNFYQLFRLCCSGSTAKLIVSVSGNGGTSWTDFDVKESVAINSISSNPDYKSLNISAVAGNKSQVLIKFTFEGASTYYWQIDDLSLTVAPDNDIKLRRAYVDFGYKDGGYYTKTPLEQVTELSFRGAILNDGALAQTDVKLNVSISDGSTNVYDQTSNTLSNFAKLGVDTLSISTPTYIPSEVKTFTATFTVSQNETEEYSINNMVSKTFEVVDSVYAHDNGVNQGTTGPASYVDGDQDGSAMGTVYDIYTETYATSVSAFIHNSTTNGTSIKATILEFTDSDVIEVLSSDFYDITGSSNKNKWVTLPIVDFAGTVLEVDKTYLVAIETWGVVPGTGGARVYLGIDRATEQPDAVNYVRTEGTSGSWGWISSGTPLIRLNVDRFAGINDTMEKDFLKVSQNIPNPASKETRISYEIPTALKVNLKVYDIAGREVIAANEGLRSAGKHQITLNTASLSAGVYYYTVDAGGAKVTKKMIISE